MAGKTEDAKSMQGARWIRAALQVNPYAYKGASAPSANFKSEAAYNSAILDRCDALGVGLIAVTDHWAVDSAKGLLKAAQDRGIGALPGFEANSSEGIHLLVLFEVGTPLDKVNAAIGACGADPGSDNGTSGNSYADILRDMTARNALVVPAHANVPKAGLLTSRGGVPLQNAIKNEHLHAIGISPGAADAADQVAIFKRRKPFDRQHPLAEIHADDVCHPDHLDEVGATTWFKVSEPCLRSLKHAVRTPQTRVSLADPVGAPRVLLRSLAWTGGFLDDVTVNFSEDLTAFIGGRGTGKSTVVESLRYVMDLQPIGDQSKRDHSAVVEKVLTTGTLIELEVEAISPKPGRFTIQRTVPGRSVVLDSSDTVTQMQPQDIVGLVEIFGQHELAEVAQQPSSVAEMLRRFSGEDGDHELDEIRSRLGSNRSQLATVEGQQAKLEEELDDMPRLKDQLEHFKDAEWPKKLAEQERLNADAAIFDEGRRRLSFADGLIEELKESDPAAQLLQTYELLDESPRAELLKAVSKATSNVGTALEKGILALEKAVLSATADIDAAEKKWKKLTADLQAGHAEVVRQLKEEGYDPDKYLSARDQLKRLRLRAQERPRLAAKRKTLLDERKKQLGELVKAETAAKKRLAAAVRRANQATGKVVFVKPISAPGREPMKQLVEDHVQSSRKSLLALIDQDDFDPHGFVAIARKGKSELIDAYGFSGAQADAVHSAGEPFFRELEEVLLEQAVEVSLDVSEDRSGKYRALAELSKGQKATALLLLLLSVSSSPLVVDQPEDDLDNRFIFDGLVTKLRQLKGQRQVIVSTHNANVPVLGDAELIVTLEGDGQRGKPNKNATGSLDHEPVRKMAEHILEGGRDAFDARRHLYGF